MDLSAELRDRRKAAGRTIASVAVDAGLSVPYIANLENGRGNPTLAALDRLASALGTRLELTLVDDPAVAISDSSSIVEDLLASSPRAGAVIAQVANSRGTSRRVVQRQLTETLEALTPLLAASPTDADLNRLLDLLLLAG